MANIRIDLKSEPLNGQSVVFKAPCDCTAITGVAAYYYDGSKLANKTFTFKDAHGNDVTGIGNLFRQGAYVKVVFDTATNSAFIQNADNNSYVAAIAAKVENLDIQTTTDSTLKDSVAGGLRFEMTGATEQKQLSGKNLIPMSIFDNATVDSSVTYENNKITVVDANSSRYGGITVSTGDVLTVGETYTFSIYLRGTSGKIAYFYCGNTGSSTRLTTSYVRHTLKITASSKSVNIKIHNGGTEGLANGEYVEFADVQIEKGETETDFEEYCGGTPSPNPSAPQSIHNTFDVGEMIQGSHSTSNGSFSSGGTKIVTNKRPVPCKVGDKVVITTDELYDYVSFVFFNGSTFVSGNYVANNKVCSFTIPSGVDNFYFNIQSNDNKPITPETVGKITLTVNGKYVGQIVEHGKNLVDRVLSTNISTNGVTCTTNGDGTYILNGTATSDTFFTLISNLEKNLEIGKRYRVTGCPKNGSINTYMLCDNYSAKFYEYGEGHTFTLTDYIQFLAIGVRKGVTVNNLVFKPMIVEADLLPNVTYDDFEPYTEKVTTFYLNEPLRATDRIVRKDGVIGVNRKRASVDLGTFVWTLMKDTYWRTTTGGNMLGRGNSVKANIVAEKYKTLDSNMATVTPNAIGLANDTHDTVKQAIYIYCNNGSTTEKPSGLMEYEVVEETYTPLDTESQIAINEMVTFDGVTYVEVDSKVKPTMEVQYGASKVGALALETACSHDSLNVKVNAAPEWVFEDQYGLDGSLTFSETVLEVQLTSMTSIPEYDEDGNYYRFVSGIASIVSPSSGAIMDQKLIKDVRVNKIDGMYQAVATFHNPYGGNIGVYGRLNLELTFAKYKPSGE